LKYSHLSLDERVELYADLKRGLSLRSVAKKLERSPASLCREIKRHTRYGRVYKPVLANNRAAKWATAQRYKAPLKNSETLRYVLDKIKLGWSPEIIEGRIGIDHPGLSVSYESIYQWIYYNKYWKRSRLWEFLECGHIKRRQKRGRNVISYTQVLETKRIELRPNTANLRLEVGHGETDNMESGRNSHAALSVTADRLTRVSHLAKVKDKTGRSKAQALQKPAPAGLTWLTITTDRGPENKRYQIWENKLGVKVYFCNAYHPWEKGTVENTIKRIRRFIPKGADITKYSWRDIKKIEYWLNTKPMKCLQYLTPYEKMAQVKQNLESEY
jgi:IS30 family transposase